MGANSGHELKASVEIDWTKASAKLRELDQQVKEEDKKAERLEGRVRRLQEEFKESERHSAHLEHKINHRLEHMLKEFGKFTAKAVVFDTLTQFSDIVPEEARGITGIAVTGLSAAVTSGNPVVGAIAAMAKSIEVLRDSQKQYQHEIESLRKDIEKREQETQRALEKLEDQRVKDQLRLLQDIEQIRTEAAKEGNELLIKSWAMTA